MLILPQQIRAGSQENFYCPQNHGYISLGMTEAEVKAACGEPLTKEVSNKPLMQQVPMTQLIYNQMGAPKAFYGIYQLPIGDSRFWQAPFGENWGGATLQVNIVNNQVHSININGRTTNAFSICNGNMIKVGDPAGSVIHACGDSSLINNTYINEPIPSKEKPQIWTYQPTQYSDTVSLTFADGKLQSID
jgi:hypothetical protein